MSKQEEIKQALAAATPGPWVASGDAVRTSDDKWICQMYEGEYDCECDFSEFPNAKSNAGLIANAPEYIDWLLKLEQSLQEDIMVLKDMVHTRNVENERLCKEIIVKENSKEVLTKQITDEVTISALAIAERDRLRKELEEKDKELKRTKITMSVHEGNYNAYFKECERLGKELEEARKIKFPRQENGEGGWEIDFAFLRKLQQLKSEYPCNSTLEEIESTLLVLEEVWGQEGEGNQ